MICAFQRIALYSDRKINENDTFHCVENVMGNRCSQYYELLVATLRFLAQLPIIIMNCQ